MIYGQLNGPTGAELFNQSLGNLNQGIDSFQAQQNVKNARRDLGIEAAYKRLGDLAKMQGLPPSELITRDPSLVRTLFSPWGVDYEQVRSTLAGMPMSADNRVAAGNAAFASGQQKIEDNDPSQAPVAPAVPATEVSTKPTPKTWTAPTLSDLIGTTPVVAQATKEKPKDFVQVMTKNSPYGGEVREGMSSRNPGGMASFAYVGRGPASKILTDANGNPLEFANPKAAQAALDQTLNPELTKNFGRPAPVKAPPRTTSTSPRIQELQNLLAGLDQYEMQNGVTEETRSQRQSYTTELASLMPNNARGSNQPQMNPTQLAIHELTTGDIHRPALVGDKEGIVNAKAMENGGKQIVENLNRRFPIYAGGKTSFGQSEQVPLAGSAPVPNQNMDEIESVKTANRMKKAKLEEEKVASQEKLQAIELAKKEMSSGLPEQYWSEKTRMVAGEMAKQQEQQAREQQAQQIQAQQKLQRMVGGGSVPVQGPQGMNINSPTEVVPSPRTIGQVPNDQKIQVLNDREVTNGTNNAIADIRKVRYQVKNDPILTAGMDKASIESTRYLMQKMQDADPTVRYDEELFKQMRKAPQLVIDKAVADIGLTDAQTAYHKAYASYLGDKLDKASQLYAAKSAMYKTQMEMFEKDQNLMAYKAGMENIAKNFSGKSAKDFADLAKAQSDYAFDMQKKFPSILAYNNFIAKTLGEAMGTQAELTQIIKEHPGSWFFNIGAQPPESLGVLAVPPPGGMPAATATPISKTAGSAYAATKVGSP